MNTNVTKTCKFNILFINISKKFKNNNSNNTNLIFIKYFITPYNN